MMDLDLAEMTDLTEISHWRGWLSMHRASQRRHESD